LSSRRPERVLIVPIFIPNQGCPHQCIFCDQEKITDQSAPQEGPAYIKQIIHTALNSKDFFYKKRREVAFYGGTFTGLSAGKISELLSAVTPFIDQGLFQSIRISTRPDEIDDERLEMIRNLGVTTIELGVQSMDDNVLMLSRRGHTSKHTTDAVGLLKKHGFKIGIQLMPGLPGDSGSGFADTVEKVVNLAPDFTRLYPALVIKGTALARFYDNGRYTPLTLEQAIEICRDSCLRLEGQGISVIRIGLMSSTSLLEDGQILAGPWHTAFGFLVRSSIFLKGIRRMLPKPGEADMIGLRLRERDIPLLRGYRNQGVNRLEEVIKSKIIYIKGDDSVLEGEVEVDFIHKPFNLNN